MFAHVVNTFLSDSGELVSEAISNGRLTELDREWRAKISTSQKTEHIDVPNTVPAYYCQ
jgi:hypothetical protein